MIAKTEDYLSKLILAISILISTFVFVFIPMLLERHSNEGIVVHTIRDTWGEGRLLLPTPTVYAVYFADHRLMRVIVFIIFVAAGVLVEMLCGNKKISGTFHAACLLLSVMLGAFLLLACILPYVPLLGT